MEAEKRNIAELRGAVEAQLAGAATTPEQDEELLTQALAGSADLRLPPASPSPDDPLGTDDGRSRPSSPVPQVQLLFGSNETLEPSLGEGCSRWWRMVSSAVGIVCAFEGFCGLCRGFWSLWDEPLKNAVVESG